MIRLLTSLIEILGCQLLLDIGLGYRWSYRLVRSDADQWLASSLSRINMSISLAE